MPKVGGQKSEVRRGFTLLEVLIAIAIILMVSFVILRTTSKFRNTQGLNGAVETTVTAMREARERTISSEEDSQYGVRLAQDRVTVFRGTSYDPAATTNKVYIFSSSVQIEEIDLVTGGSDIIFNRLVGTTSNYGTTTISLRSATSTHTEIVVLQSGVIEIHN